VIMRAGSIAAEGTPDELRHRLGNASDVSFALPAEVSLEQLGSVVGCVVEFDGQSARFRSDRAQDDLTLLLDWAQRRNVTLTDLQVSIPTLDDVFLALADGHDTDGDEIR
jgi:ABC-type multidrug transport system ATPase subunit